MAELITACIVCGIRPPYAPSLLCGGCYARLWADLDTLVMAHTWLGVVMITPAPSFKPGSRHRRGGSRPPLVLALHDAREQIEAVLGSWVAWIAYKHEPILVGPADKSVPGLAAWLQAHLPWCSDQPWCPELVTSLAEQRSHAHGIAPWDRGRRDMAAPCPKCGYLSLSVYGGSDAISCRNRECGRILAWADYELHVRERAAVQTALGRLEQKELPA